MVCAAARLPPIVFKHYVDLMLGSAFVLIYETRRVWTAEIRTIRSGALSTDTGSVVVAALNVKR